ncbi:phage tail termination protein [Streptomyces sp. URMC 124]|uniref:phage tail termination protein n=1 Tax=Streptomyces sp. URMC 124 TaxID=3423405 RepID=UPI003F1E2FDC
MRPVLPDVDALVVDALREGLGGAQVRVLWPADWADQLPMVVARRVPGGRSDARGIDVALIDVQAVARDRREASRLARVARVVLADACRSQHRGPDGYLARFEDVTGPAEIRTGEPEAGPDLFRFQATYRVTARPI